MSIGDDNMISVIIPTYNREKMIKRTVLNVLSQSYDDIEVIIVDDNSTDHTKEIIDSILDSRIRYYKNSVNKGACFSRNFGVKVSKGEFIAFQDSDDLWDINKLYKQLNYLKLKKADIVFCSLRKYDQNQNVVGCIPNHKITDSKINYDNLLLGNFISTQTLFGKRECFENVLFDEKLARFQDWDLVLNLSKKYKIVFQNDELAFQYIQDDSITSNYTKALQALDYIYEKHYKHVLDKDALFYYWDLYGMCQYQIYSKQSCLSYVKAFHYKKNIKSFFKILLSNTKYLNYFLTIKRKDHSIKK